MQILAFGYWIPLLVIGLITNLFMSSYDGALPTSIIAFWFIQIIVWGSSWFASGLDFCGWYRKVFFYGAHEFSIMIANSSVDSIEDPPMWKHPFEFWWSFSMKYLFSWAVY